VNEFLDRAIAYLKPAGEVESVSLATGSAQGAQADAPVIKQLAAGVVVTYVVDEPEGLVFIQNRHIAEAGIGIDELHMIGLGNLNNLCKKQLRVERHGPIYGLFLDGNFEASVILLEYIWQIELADLVEESFTIAIPARDILAFCDSSSEEGVATLKQMIGKIAENGDHLISRGLFRKDKHAPDGM
jgi:uncharacterized protein YtpQ (UPF0354 family)